MKEPADWPSDTIGAVVDALARDFDRDRPTGRRRRLSGNRRRPGRARFLGPAVGFRRARPHPVDDQRQAQRALTGVILGKAATSRAAIASVALFDRVSSRLARAWAPSRVRG